MSHVTELARAEADEVEAAEEEETEAPEPEPTPEPEPEPAVGEKAMRAMEREESRHAGAVAKVMGEAFAEFHRCPLCAAFPAGFVPGFAGVPDEMAAELGSQVAAYFGDAGLIEPPYVEGRTMQRCPDCDGWGQVKSGARNALHRNEQCPGCMGNGYVARTQTYAPPQPTPVLPAGAGGGFPQPLPYLDVHGNQCAVPPDQYGRRFGDMSYGQPQTVGGNGA